MWVGGCLQGGQGMSTKVSGTTAGGQFFAAGAAPKDITLANEAAWGQLGAADGAAATTTTTDGAAVEGGGAAAAADGTAAAPAAEGGAVVPAAEGAAAAAGGDGVPPAAGAAAAEAGASGDAPAADDAGGKVMLTEFEQFNREQQRRQEALRKQVWIVP